MNLLVTGGYGFIGSHFVEHQVSQGTTVYVWDSFTYAASRMNLPENTSREIIFENIDISDSESVSNASKHLKSIDWIVNFAAESHVDNSIENPGKFASTNILGTINLLNLVRNGIASKFFQISTDEVYGSTMEETWTEAHPINPRSPYSASKASAELFVGAYKSTYGFESIITRSANNFGPRQSLEKLIPKVIYMLMNNEEIPIYGDGLNVREWISVQDHVEILSQIIRSDEPLNGTFNIAGVERNNLEIVNEISQIMGKESPKIKFVKDRLGHDRRYSMSDSKIRNTLNLPEKNLLDFHGTVEWYLSNPLWIHESLQKIKL